MSSHYRKILKGLNDEQTKAVAYGEGPLLIVAGAGTGKTQVITRRIAHLITTKKAKPEEILALTFTEKAALEMEERVDVLIPYGYADFWVCTFHAFGDRILRENALEIGLSPDFQVLSLPEQVIFFREHLFEFPLSYYCPLGNPTRYIQAILTLISRAKDEDVTPQDYLEYVGRLEEEARGNPEDKELKEKVLKEREIALTYKKYQELLAKEGKVDFGDQITLTLKLFRQHPSILKEYQQHFRYILIDEFQDTNYSQFQLVKLLAKEHPNVTVVGDDDQCLPPGTLVKIKGGERKIEKIKSGEKILTAVGKGYTTYSRVLKVFKRKKKTHFLTFHTENGYKVEVTDNHKLFCFISPVPPKKNLYYVYLMCRQGSGWRIGTTSDLVARLRLERSADKIIALRCFNSEKEAKYFETLWFLKYGIPTVCFMKRDKSRICDELLERLYKESNVNEGARALANDLRIDLDAHHFSLDGVNRGDKTRVKIHLEMCYRKNSLKSSRDKPFKNLSVLHQVSLQTSNKTIIEKLKLAKVPMTKAKKGIRVRVASSRLEKVGAFAEYLKKVSAGVIESKFSLGTLNMQHKPALVIPASNVLVGFYLPVLKNSKVIYDKVIRVSKQVKEETVYDLEVDCTHNFVANGIVVHNSIYKFRGAAISNILGFLDSYPDAQQVVLTKNYRSSQQILDSAYRLIRCNDPDRLEFKNKINKRLIAVKKDSGRVEFFCYDSLLSEAESVAKLISEKVKKGEYKWNDFAILVRANNSADPFLRALNMVEVPWRFSGNEGLYDQEEVRLLICFLKVLINLDDSISLYYLASSEIYQISVKDLTLCMNYASRKNRSLFYVFSHLNELTDLSEQLFSESKVIVERLLKELEDYLKKSVKLSTGQIIYQFITETQFLGNLTKVPSLENERKVKNIARFFELVQNASQILNDNKAINFVKYLNLLIQAGDNPAVVEADLEIDAVNVLTIHKAKGLEFPVIIMVSLINQRFPSIFRREAIALPNNLIRDILPSGDFHRQEERRLFYVGMTRAKKELYFTSAQDYGGKKLRKVSPFVLETLNLSIGNVSTRKRSALEVIERSAPPKEEKETSYRRILKGEIITLSYFRIDDYLTCPLKYKYIHILRVPILQHHAVIYGKALHDAVQKYYQYKLQGEKLSLEELIACFENSWINEGFISREHEEKRLEKGKMTLVGFYQRAEEEKILPTHIEKKFSFMLDKDRITGRWDRVDVVKDKVSIMDYKSSQIEDKKKADKRTKESLQLAIYALAYKRIFGKIPDLVKLYFLETGVVGEASLNENNLMAITEKIKKASEGIRKRIFDSQPGYISCRFCPYQSICPDEGSKKYI